MRFAIAITLILLVSCAKGNPGVTNNENNSNNLNNVNNSTGFGTACSGPGECESGYCINFPDSGSTKCTILCSEQDCPGGFICRQASRQDPTTVCLPLSTVTCSTCDSDSQCGEFSDRCIIMSHEGGCLSDCSVQGLCQNGYVCTATSSVDGISGNYCLPSAGTCGCTEANSGTQTSCSIENEYGTCTGIKECMGNSGWSPCNADIPAPEICDGVDNNCDGNVDEGVLGTVDHCEACNSPCEGQGVTGTQVECIDFACEVSCESDYYDSDNSLSNGCECSDDTTGGDSTASAYNLGNFSDCDFTHPVTNLHVPRDSANTGHSDFFRYFYENDSSVFCWNYNYIELSVPSSSVSMQLCAGFGVSESSWSCISVNPGQTNEIMLPEISNGDSVNVYFKVVNTASSLNCGDYNITVYDDGDL